MLTPTAVAPTAELGLDELIVYASLSTELSERVLVPATTSTVSEALTVTFPLLPESEVPVVHPVPDPFVAGVDPFVV